MKITTLQHKDTTGALVITMSLEEPGQEPIGVFARTPAGQRPPKYKQLRAELMRDREARAQRQKAAATLSP